MPHCIIEHSKDIVQEIESKKLIETVFTATLESELFGESQIKTRTISYENYQIGREQKSFIHVTSRILSGRTPEQKKQLSQKIFSRLREIAHDSIVITVDIVDMDRDSYSK